jgi:putative selenium metabolism hydrolase
VFELDAQDKRSLTDFVRDLVRIPSPPGHEGEVADRLAAEMRAVGLQDVHRDKVGSVLGRLGTGAAPVLVLNGHMDTVGIGDSNAWQQDPFGAALKDGVIHGRGACDMKGGLAALVYGTKLLHDAGVSLRGTLYVVGVVQEETCEGLAMRILMEEEGLKPDYVVLGEPSDLRLALGHRGRIELKVTTRGRAAHGSAPERGENAIYHMARLALGVEQLNRSLGTDPILGRASISLNTIAGGQDLNVVPDTCVAQVDRRLTRGEDETGVVKEVLAVADRAGVSADVEVLQHDCPSYNGYRCTAHQFFPAWVTSRHHPLAQAMLAAASARLGHEPDAMIWAFSTDGAYTAGTAGVPTVGFGPGEERLAHTVEERVRVDDLFAAAEVYARLAHSLLGE